MAFELVEKNGFSDDFYPDYIACIDGSLKNTHLIYGIAQYWDAKHIQAFSKQKIVLAQHWADLQEQKHITSDAFFKPAYDFAIISEYAGQKYTLSQKKLFAINGKPQKTIHCGNRTLLVYGRDRLRVQSKEKKVTTMQIQALEKT